MLLIDQALADAQPILLEWWPVISFAAAVVAAGAGWVIRREVIAWKAEVSAQVSAEIAEATKPIQPDANGGKSLADANRKLDQLTALPALMESVLGSVEDLRDRVGAVEASNAQHLRDHAQARSSAA